MANVLFVCLHNAGPSQMSQALFERAAAATAHKAASAGTTPGERVHPEVVVAMRELSPTSRPAASHRRAGALGRRRRHDGMWRRLPVHCRHPLVDWQLADPKGRPIDEVPRTRDEIARLTHALLSEL
jgi:protein-tyrosine-phosphatase